MKTFITVLIPSESAAENERRRVRARHVNRKCEESVAFATLQEKIDALQAQQTQLAQGYANEFDAFCSPE